MDSSDYCECQVCKMYEICLVTDGFGKESGLYGCQNGHTFCKECYPNFVREFEEKIYSDIDFIRRELDMYVRNSNNIRYSDHEHIDSYKEWLKMSDSDLKNKVIEENVFNDIYYDIPEEYCPVCNSSMRFTDAEIVRYMFKKYNVTRDQIADEMGKK